MQAETFARFEFCVQIGMKYMKKNIGAKQTLANVNLLDVFIMFIVFAFLYKKSISNFQLKNFKYGS